MRAIVKWILSHELEADQLPADPTDCEIIVTAGIGEAHDEAADDFTFWIVTPTSLARQVANGRYRAGRHLIIVESFEWSVVKAAVSNLVEAQQAETWEDLATRIGRYGFWEFEDYQDGTKLVK